MNATDFDRNLAEFVDKLEIAAAVITICTSPINPVGALTIFSGVVASVDLAIEDKRFNGEMTQEEYDSDYYQTYRKAKVCLDVVTGLVTLPKLAVGLTKFTKSAILGSVRLGQKYIRNGKHVILAFAIRNSVRNAKLGNTLPNATALMREVAECVRTGKVYVFTSSRVNWNGYVNIFEATASEIVEATNRIKNHRTTTGNLIGGNYGYLEGSINNAIVDNKMWRSVSTSEALNEIHIFDAIEAQGASGTWLRITDSEYRMLNKLASDLGAVKGGRYTNIVGEMKIVSENPYCASCTGIIQQFHEMFPNIKLILVDGAK